MDAHGVTVEIESFEQALVACPDLKLALESPTVPPARKRAVVGRLAESLPLSSLVLRFFYVLIDQRRVALIGDVREAFQAVIDERQGSCAPTYPRHGNSAPMSASGYWPRWGG